MPGHGGMEDSNSMLLRLLENSSYSKGGVCGNEGVIIASMYTAK
jgi:hypothetical protein